VACVRHVSAIVRGRGRHGSLPSPSHVLTTQRVTRQKKKKTNNKEREREVAVTSCLAYCEVILKLLQRRCVCVGGGRSFISCGFVSLVFSLFFDVDALAALYCVRQAGRRFLLFRRIGLEQLCESHIHLVVKHGEKVYRRLFAAALTHLT
jgi:hypothetical protein